MKVFALSYLSDYCHDMSSAGVHGVYPTLEQAQAAMKELYDDRMNDVLDRCGKDNAEDLTIDDDVNLCTMEREHSIYCKGDKDEWKITEWDVPEVSAHKDRSLAMLEMERELIEIVQENGDDDYLDVDDLDMAWTEECDGELYTTDIFSLEVKQSWDGDNILIVHMHGCDREYFECDQEDLGHNLADYIYEEVKAYY